MGNAVATNPFPAVHSDESSWVAPKTIFKFIGKYLTRFASKHKVCRQPSKLRRVEFDSHYSLQF